MAPGEGSRPARAQLVAAGVPPHRRPGLRRSSQGNPYGSDYYGKLFRATVARTTVSKDTSSHDLRHHYASVLLAAGESVVAVAARLGHENASPVHSTYGHLMPDSEERTRRARAVVCPVHAPLAVAMAASPRRREPHAVGAARPGCAPEAFLRRSGPP